jgi:DNA-binding MarR family transcriptional regulator
MPTSYKDANTGKGSSGPPPSNEMSVSLSELASNRTARADRSAIKLGSIEGRVGYHIQRLQVWVFRDFNRTLSDLEIRPNQYSVLALIAANPGLSQIDISIALDIERARLVRLLDGLEKRGLLLRRRVPNDRRSHALQLTETGQKLFAQAELLVDEHEARLAARVGSELYELLRAAMYENDDLESDLFPR